jgi:hypothetical protein
LAILRSAGFVMLDYGVGQPMQQVDAANNADELAFLSIGTRSI